RAGQAGRGDARRRGHPRVLPRPARRGRGAAPVVPRGQALQATEAVAVMTRPHQTASDAEVPRQRPTPEASDDILVFRDVHLSFERVRAIDGVSFTVGRDELFAIIGPNGAGKTSIFNVLSGVYRPQAGEVVFDGVPILGRKPHQIARLGM